MGAIAFLGVFIATPIFALWRLKSVTWTLVALALTFGFVGGFVQVTGAFGMRWTLAGLQWALLAACMILLVVALVGRNPHRSTWRPQVLGILLPAAFTLAFLVVSRVLAPSSGPFANVGYFVLNRGAEDNADWLDIAGRLASGGVLDASAGLGGPVQLLIAFTATLATALSLVAYGGMNEVLVASSSVLLAQFFLASSAPLALAPLAERRLAIDGSGVVRSRLPAMAVWSGGLVLVVMSFAAMGFGHLSMQFAFVTVTLWFAVFWVSFPMPRVRLVTTMVFALTSLVWFPLAPLALVAVTWYGGWLVYSALRKRHIDWLSWAIWLSTLILIAQPLRRALMYIFLTTSAALPGIATPGFFGRIAGAGPVPALVLLESQGGTETIGPILGLLAFLAVMVSLPVVLGRRGAGRSPRLLPFAPMALLLGYGLGIATLGSWLVASGPNYGAVKTIMLATTATLAVALPVAIGYVSTAAGLSKSLPGAALFGVAFLLVVDGVFPRAMVRVSPEAWRSTYETFGQDRQGYWWPAEVQPTGAQPIRGNPVACLYLPVGAPAPAGGPDGQLTYSCSRILMGLAGQDNEGQPVVDWLRRDWLNNEQSWFNEWPNLRLMPRELLTRPVILLNDDNAVVGLDSLESLLDRYRPEWAVGGPLYEVQPQ